MRLDKNKILLKMAKKGFSQQELADHAGASRQTISAVVNGRTCRPQLLAKIAKALDAEPEEIIEN